MGSEVTKSSSSVRLDVEEDEGIVIGVGELIRVGRLRRIWDMNASKKVLAARMF